MAKLYCILARSANSAVIFRRGPTKQVRLIKWNIADHTFELGQWFKGRIYERKSDLSPNGRKLVYFAAKYTGGLPTWIAISSPPFLTAHVLWGADGTWNDISMFDSDRTLALATYRSDSSLKPHAGFEIPSQLEVRSKPWPGMFYKFSDHSRLVRDGWSVVSGDPVYRGPGKAGRITYRKSVSGGVPSSFLEMSGTGEEEIEYSLVAENSTITPLGTEWADARENEIFYSTGGKLMRIKVTKYRKQTVFDAATEIADFTEMNFKGIEAPTWATRW